MISELSVINLIFKLNHGHKLTPTLVTPSMHFCFVFPNCGLTHVGLENGCVVYSRRGPSVGHSACQKIGRPLKLCLPDKISAKHSWQFFCDWKNHCKQLLLNFKCHLCFEEADGAVGWKEHFYCLISKLWCINSKIWRVWKSKFLNSGNFWMTPAVEITNSGVLNPSVFLCWLSDEPHHIHTVCMT